MVTNQRPDSDGKAFTPSDPPPTPMGLLHDSQQPDRATIAIDRERAR